MEDCAFESAAMAGVGTHDAVMALLDEPDGLPVLDLGAGTGALTRRLAGAGHRVTAYGMVSEQYAAGAPYRLVDLDQGLPDADGSVGGIVAVEILEHLESPLALMREAGRVLTGGGWLIVTTPNVLSWAAKLSVLVRDNPVYFGEHEYRTNGHISPLPLPTIRRMGERLGLHVEVVTYNIGLLPLPKGRHRLPLRGGFWRRQAFGQSLIVKLRKVGEPVDFARG